MSIRTGLIAKAAGKAVDDQPRLGYAARLATALAVLTVILLAATPAVAREFAEEDRIVVRLVDENGVLVSEHEAMEPVVRTVFDETGTRTITLGTRATLWVRNANVNGKFAFERYHEGRYIYRSAELEIPPLELGVGEHVINPGNHKFTINPDWTITSDDPEISIDDMTISLRLHRVQVYGVDGGKTGPPEYRLVASQLGLITLGEDATLDPENLPDPRRHTNLLSHIRSFYPLTIYLPSNTKGTGYVLYPSWQAFHLTHDGTVDFAATGTPRVPGVEAEASEIVIGYRTFFGRRNSNVNLAGAVGNVNLSSTMHFSPTLESIKFTAGIGTPPQDFYLDVDNDFSKNPNKMFFADNTTADPYAIRLLAIEWGHPVFTSGEAVTVAARYLETEGKNTIPNPVARVAWSRYDSRSPEEYSWRDAGDVFWQDGELTFTVPELPYDFYNFRVMIIDADSADTHSPIQAELLAAVIKPGQQGTASLISNKARDAFVIGEDISLQVVLRSENERPAGQRQLVFTHPNGRKESFSFNDPGAKWFVQPAGLAGDITINLQPGQYELVVEGNPENIAAVPYVFDLVSNQKKSLYYIIKPSKYTMQMNRLIPSHTGDREQAVNFDRAVATLAELGYNRLDLMTYETNFHIRPHTSREQIAGLDLRLMAPETVYQPTPRNQLLNACVRYGLEFSDVFLSYNDFHIPRLIEGYISASKRWITREMLSMRHSPALAGMMLYDEMYDMAVSGLVEEHVNLFPAMRYARAEEEFGKPVAQITSAMSRFVARPPAQRDPQALEDYLAYNRWERSSWGDYNERVAAAAREVLPGAKMGTYHRTWMGVGTTLGLTNGWPADVFRGLDLISHVHYADNITGWVHSSMMASALRINPRRPVFINIPLMHESRGRHNGEYQRHMAFAMLAQGADGVSQYGITHSFENDANPMAVAGKETTAHLNREILAPLGELVSRTDPGYQKVGIVSTMNQYLLNSYLRAPVQSQVEAIWIACWRLGYPAIFLNEKSFDDPVTQFDVIFVPGIRFDGTLEPYIMERLEEAARAGVKIVVERGSTLSIPGVVELDNPLQDYFVRVYFPTWLDDELNKIFEKSQPATDYFAKKLPELGVEPAARGPFKVGPNWRSSGKINYLIMGNFDDPEYGHAIKQIQTKPIRMPLTIAAHRGNIAYDLLRAAEIPLTPAGEELNFELDMTNIEGGFVAFLPEPVGRLDVDFAQAQGNLGFRLAANLVGASGEMIPGVFPTRIRLIDTEGRIAQEFYRTLGQEMHFEMRLPATATAQQYAVEVRENITGRTAKTNVTTPVLQGPTVQLIGVDQPLVPYPHEVEQFLAEIENVTLITSSRIPGIREVADELAAMLRDRGVEVTIEDDEMSAYRFPHGDDTLADPYNDGFHSWRNDRLVIQPSTVIDAPVIIMAGNQSSYILDGLMTNGYIVELPTGTPGRTTRPSVQVAKRGLHFAYDTLCLIGNDASSLRLTVQVLAQLPAQRQPAAPQYAQAQRISGTEATQAEPPINFMGNNELIVDIKFDSAGNVYVITWGHGDNIYSLDTEGNLRFSRHLPEMGAFRLDVFEDRLLVATAAGSRLYQMTLDGQPISQVRLTKDPGSSQFCEDYALSFPVYEYLPGRNMVLSNNDGMMRLLDEHANPVVTWRGKEYVDEDVSDRTLNRSLHGHAISPDRTRLAQLEASRYYTQRAHEDAAVYDTHLVIRDFEGNLLHEYSNIANESEDSGVTSQLRWHQGDPGPYVVVKGERWQFDGELNLLYTKAYDQGMFQLGVASTAFEREHQIAYEGTPAKFSGNLRLVRDGNSLRLLDGSNPELSRMGPFDIMPTYSNISPDRTKVAFLDEYGVVKVYATETGELQHEFAVPELGRVIRFNPESDSIFIGGQRGRVMRYPLGEGTAYQAVLGQFNKNVENPLLHDPVFTDNTENLWPVLRDRPGELDEIVRMGENRLVNGDFSGDDGWQGELQFHDEGYNSGRSLKVGSSTVYQDVTRYLGNHVTWVLEFFYRAAPGSESPELLAGVLVDSKYADSVARRFKSNDDWQFARIAVKGGRDCQLLKIGLRAFGGDVLVDQATLRQIRFPSVNHLHYEPLYEVDPIILTNPLFLEDYDPVGDLRYEAFGQVTVPPYQAGGKPMVEPSFMQNARINDMDSFWYEMPYGYMNEFAITLSLREPRWVSHVAIFCNYYDEENVAPHVDVYVVDPETGKETLAASVSHNQRLFHVISFPTMRAAAVRLELPNSIKRLRTFTEIELYGPLTGREDIAGAMDPDGQHTYMGDFSRVDKREKVLAEEYNDSILVNLGHGAGERVWAVPVGQILAADDQFYVTRSLGYSDTYRIEDAMKSTHRYAAQPRSLARSRAFSFNEHLTHYGGLLLKTDVFGTMYCIDAATNQTVWTVGVGERFAGAPVVHAEDVFIATDTAKLYKIDLANGSIMMDVELSGPVHGSIASDGRLLYMITFDGYLHCYDSRTFDKVWSVEIAPFTDSTPAVDKGVVYLADQRGTARAIEAATGKVLWSAELGQEFIRCPVVTSDRVLFGCRGGRLVVLNRSNGAELWAKQVRSRFIYEPLVLGEYVFYLEGSTAKLAALADGSDSEREFPNVQVVVDPITSISYYRGALFFVSRVDHGEFHYNAAWHLTGGRFSYIFPKPAPEEEKK